jgi:uridine phosphorylase
LIERSSAPILEFDPSRAAMIEPSRLYQVLDVPEHCVICFFKEVLNKVAAEKNAKILATHSWEDGKHCLYEIEHRGRRLAFIHPGVGGPLAAGILEDAIAHGCRKFVVCGGCGALDKELALGHLILVSSAVRDEGVSYHYLAPSREVQANAPALAALEAAVMEQGLPYRRGKTWTTDAPYRETAAKVALRRAEGCLTVEMEAASLMAVAQFRKVALGQILYSGDDLSGEVWSDRGWVSLKDVRENLFWLAADACLSL